MERAPYWIALSKLPMLRGNSDTSPSRTGEVTPLGLCVSYHHGLRKASWICLAYHRDKTRTVHNMRFSFKSLAHTRRPTLSWTSAATARGPCHLPHFATWPAGWESDSSGRSFLGL